MWGPPLFWDHRGPRRMGAGPPFNLGPALPRCMGEGASLALERPSPHRMGVGAYSALGTGGPAAWARGLPPLWDHRGPRRVSAGASSALAPPGPPPREPGGILRLRGRRWSPARSPSECRGWQIVHHGGYPYILELWFVPTGTGAWGECVLLRTGTPPAGVLCTGGGRVMGLRIKPPRHAGQAPPSR